MIFTMTATLRPSIIEQLLVSLQTNLLNVDMSQCCLIINIDPVPHGSDPMEIVELSKRFFGTVKYNIPQTPNFCQAVKWLWSQPSDPFIFHLEDDWELFIPIDFNEMLKIFVQKKLYQLRLTKFLKKSATKKYGLSPCLVNNTFYASIAKNLDPNLNPERQFLNVAQWGLQPHCPSTIEAYPQGQIVIRDIGRIWREKKGLNKHKNENLFITWS